MERKKNTSPAALDLQIQGTRKGLSEGSGKKKKSAK